jgi:hypothetical protein
MEYGFPVRSTHEYSYTDDINDASTLAEYLYGHCGENGLPIWRSYPVTAQHQEKGKLNQALHALYALGRAGEVLGRSEWTHAAVDGISYCLERFNTDPPGTVAVNGWQSGWATNVLLVLAVSATSLSLGHEKADELASIIYRSFMADGRIAPPGSHRPSREDHDYLPGATIFALAEHSAKSRTTNLTRLPLTQSLQWYKRRFSLLHPWGMVLWHPLAWTSVHHLKARPEYASFVFDIADWALNYQLDHNGAFLTNLDATGPSFHTACISEAVAAAWALAENVRDWRRARAYGDSWKRAMAFMRSLMITSADMFCMRDRQALGGVRLNQTSSEVRIDYISHTLLAFLGGLAVRNCCGIRQNGGTR